MSKKLDTPFSASDDTQLLKSVMDQFGTADVVVERLKEMDPSYRRIGRSTFYRWKTLAETNAIPERGRRALRRALATSVRPLRLAYHEAVFSLPALLIHPAPAQESGPSIPTEDETGSILKEMGGSPTLPKRYDSGPLVLQAVAKHEADVALINADYFQDVHDQQAIQMIAGFGQGPKHGVSFPRVELITELTDYDIFVPTQRIRDEVVRLLAPRATSVVRVHFVASELEAATKAVRLLRRNRPVAAIGWPTYIDGFVSQSSRLGWKQRFEELSPSKLPKSACGLLVNLTDLDLDAFLVFLRALGKLQSDTRLQEHAIRRGVPWLAQLKLSEAQGRAYLRDGYEFPATLTTIVDVWYRHATRLRSNS